MTDRDNEGAPLPRRQETKGNSDMAECESCGRFGHRIPNQPGQVGSAVTLDDHGNCPSCATGRYYWHESIARELRYLADERGMTVVPVATVAANMRPIPRADTRRHVAEMVGWGELTESPDGVALASVESCERSEQEGTR